LGFRDIEADVKKGRIRDHRAAGGEGVGMNMNRKRLLQLLLGATAVVTLISGVRVRSGAAAAEQVIHLTAKSSSTARARITVKKGQPVVIEIVIARPQARLHDP